MAGSDHLDSRGSVCLRHLMPMASCALFDSVLRVWIVSPHERHRVPMAFCTHDILYTSHLHVRGGVCLRRLVSMVFCALLDGILRVWLVSLHERHRVPVASCACSILCTFCLYTRDGVCLWYLVPMIFYALFIFA